MARELVARPSLAGVVSDIAGVTVDIVVDIAGVPVDIACVNTCTNGIDGNLVSSSVEPRLASLSACVLSALGICCTLKV